jgi:CDP-diacylglycerol--serine O-phosphatidyltransferase
MSALKFIPNLLTLSNLFFGLWAIIYSFEQEFEMAAILICLSGLADFFDGMIARLVKADGELGKQLDSLADVVSFGVAPSMALWNLCWSFHPQWTTHLILCLPLFTAYRLAKFNLDPEQSTVFKGLPSPAAGLALVSLAAAAEAEFLPTFLNANGSWIYPTVALTFGLLMVSNLPMFSLKINKTSKPMMMPLILFISAIICITLFKWAGITMTMFFYVILSIVTTFVSAKHHQ